MKSLAGWPLPRGLLLLTATIYGALLIHIGPLATNDGPIHLTFAQLLGHYGQPQWPLQSQIYTLNNALQPNMTVYLLLRALLQVFTPDLSETILQTLCLITPALAAHYALRQIDPDNGWLALFALPLTANQMFFLGLYNFLFSLTGFFLVIAFYLHLRTRPSLRLALTLGSLLILTLLSHAAGFIMAVLAMLVLAGVRLRSDLHQQRTWAQIWHGHRYLLLALCLPAPLLLWFMLQQHGAPTEYGLPLSVRLGELLRAKLFRPQSLNDRLVADTLLALQLAAILRVMLLLWQTRRQSMAGSVQQEELRGAFAVLIAFFAFCLLVPDVSGGGWTHFHRAALFPMLWMLPCIAFVRFAPWQRLAGSIIAIAVLAVQFSFAISMQQRVQLELAALPELDRHIGAHCTVLPVIESSVQYDQHGWPTPLGYAPLFQATNRLELTQDRVVLFNFLARLRMYPIRFRPGYDTQALLFHWRPEQTDVQVERLDVSRFEQQTGIPVDYVVIWGQPLDRDPVAPYEMDRALRNARLIYAAPDQQVRLYRRIPQQPDLCTNVPDAPDAAKPLVTVQN